MAQVSGIIEVSNEAILGTGLLSMNKRQLEQIVPEVSGNLDYIETTAVVAMSHVIGKLGRSSARPSSWQRPSSGSSLQCG